MEQSKAYQVTPLYGRHVALGAKMVDFCGWKMPLYYEGIIAEHRAVRSDVGIFDVSHMGCIDVVGRDASSFLDFLSTNSILGRLEGNATYTLLTTESGGCIDDVIVFKIDEEHFFVITNACNRHKDFQHLEHYSKDFDVTVRFKERGIIAVQGPNSDEVMRRLFTDLADIKPMHFVQIKPDTIVSATGYTGERGYELCCSLEDLLRYWDSLIRFGAKPIGLGARDTLRLEMGYALYGNELSEDIAASETVAAWTIQWNKSKFLGKEALEQLEKRNSKRQEYGIVLDEGIARTGYPVFRNDTQIGVVTSGNYSPTLDKGIAVVLVTDRCSIGDHVAIEIRKKRYPATIVPIPFYQKHKG